MLTATQDYSVWLTPERLAVEEELWREVAIYRLYADEVLKTILEHDCRRVIEIGCGTGWVPTCLPLDHIIYTGVDANADCLRLAREKVGSRVLLHADIRELKWASCDVVCSFAVLKHFALHEWADILGRVLSFGRFGVFTMNVGDADVDDVSQGFPHTWVSMATLMAAVEAAGHRIVSTELLQTTETMVRTCIRS